MLDATLHLDNDLSQVGHAHIRILLANLRQVQHLRSEIELLDKAAEPHNGCSADHVAVVGSTALDENDDHLDGLVANGRLVCLDEDIGVGAHDEVDKGMGEALDLHVGLVGRNDVIDEAKLQTL